MKRVLRVLLVLLLVATAGFAVFWYSRPEDLSFEEHRGGVPHAEASRFAEVGGVRLHFQEKGGGPALVLIHGNNSSAYTWKDVFDRLAAEFRVVALDLEGFGFSEKPAGGDYRVEAQAALVVGLMDELKIERAVLVGNSYGGAVALAAAEERPERVAGLVLADSNAFADSRGASLAPAYVRWPYVGAALTALALTSDRLVRDGLLKSFHDPSKVTDERVAAYYLPLTTRAGQRGALEVRRQRSMERVESLLSRVNRPALLIWGDDDRLVPLEEGRRLQAALPSARLLVFDSCGHLPQEEMPERFAAEVAAFASRFKTLPPV